MTPADFRRVALSLPGAIESAHMNHPDFRAGGRIFATLGYPDDRWGMVNLNPQTQREFVQLSPENFEPVPGGWGRKGSTRVRLESVDETILHEALRAAWGEVTQKRAAGRSKKQARL